MDKSIELTAHVSDNKLHLRQSYANAELEDGTKVEIATNIDGSTLATITRQGKEGWRTYVITPQAFVEAVLKAEGIEP